MAKPLQGIDWPALRAAYMSGRSMSEIADTYGVKRPTLCRRIEREGWKANKRELEKVVSTAVIQTARTVSNDATEGMRMRETRIAERFLDVLEKVDLRGLEGKEFSAFAGGFQTVSQVARRALGMDQDLQLSSLATGIGIGLSFSQPSESLEDVDTKRVEGQTIDVPSNPE